MVRDIIVKNIVELLPLAEKPAGIDSMSDWHPFAGGATLGTLVDTLNNRCLDVVINEWKWPPEDIRDFAQYLRVVNYDLSTATELERSRFKRIIILLMDTGDVEGHEKEINEISRKIAAAAESARLVHHLGQVSKQGGSTSKFSLFQGLRIRPSNPQVLPNEATFYAWLGEMCVTYHSAVDALRPGSTSPEPSGPTALGIRIPAGFAHDFSPQVQKDFRKEIHRIAVEVRDNALVNSLSVEETRGLAIQAGIQEIALLQIKHNIQNQFDIPSVDVASLRCPVEDLSTSQTVPAFEPLDLMAVKIDRPWRSLSIGDRQRLIGWGFNRNHLNSVVFYNPMVQKYLVSNVGKVQLQKFSASLPRGLRSKGFHWSG